MVTENLVVDLEHIYIVQQKARKELWIFVCAKSTPVEIVMGSLIHLRLIGIRGVRLTLHLNTVLAITPRITSLQQLLEQVALAQEHTVYHLLTIERHSRIRG